MINKTGAYMFCKEDICNIENYYEAISDNNELWVCHHRDEIRVLPSGMVVKRSSEELKESGRYYNCPANELIFMRRSEHARLHSTGRIYSAETRNKLSKSAYNQWKDQDRESMGNKVSKALKGRKLTKEHVENMRAGHTGLKRSEEYKKQQSIRMKGLHKGQHWKVVNGRRVWYV